MKQLLYNVRFNLRVRNSNKPTTLYCKVCVEGKQHRFPTGLKVYPKQWDNDLQLAVISNVQSKIDNYNNKIVNDKIAEFKESFMNYLIYLSTNNVQFNSNTLKTYMIKKESPSKIIEDAYEYLYKGKSVYKSYKSRLNKYQSYLEDKSIDSLDAFTQSGFNAYKKYLEEIGTTKDAINKDCATIAKLINEVLAVEDPFLNYKIAGNIKFIKEKDVRPAKGRFPLDAEELSKIEQLTINDDDKFTFEDIAPISKDGKVNNKYRSTRNGKILREYRDIFVVHCHCGQRVSDLKQFLMGQYDTIEKDGNVFYRIATKKSQRKIESFIERDKYIVDFQRKYKDGFSVDISKIGNANDYYNLAIKKICKLCNLNRIIVYWNAKGEECRDKLYEKITNHDARHTFITMKIKEGYSPDKLCYLTGHIDDTMIKQIYTQLTGKDKVNILIEENSKINKKSPKDNKDVNALLQELFAYDDLKSLLNMTEAGIYIMKLPIVDKCVDVIKSNFEGLDKLKSIISNYSKEEIEDFNNKLKELSGITVFIAGYKRDIQFQSIYEYKCLTLGVRDKVTPEADLVHFVEDVYYPGMELEPFTDNTFTRVWD